MMHEIKCWPHYFEAIWDGTKTFEVRKNDRNYQVGDRLYIRCWDPATEFYNGSYVQAVVEYVLKDRAAGIEKGYCVLAIHVNMRRYKPESDETAKP